MSGSLLGLLAVESYIALTIGAAWYAARRRDNHTTTKEIS